MTTKATYNSIIEFLQICKEYLSSQNITDDSLIASLGRFLFTLNPVSVGESAFPTQKALIFDTVNQTKTVNYRIFDIVSAQYYKGTTIEANAQPTNLFVKQYPNPTAYSLLSGSGNPSTLYVGTNALRLFPFPENSTLNSYSVLIKGYFSYLDYDETPSDVTISKIPYDYRLFVLYSTLVQGAKQFNLDDNNVERLQALRDQQYQSLSSISDVNSIRGGGNFMYLNRGV